MSQLSPRPELEPDFRDYEPIHPEPGWKSFLRKLWAPIVGIGAFLAKFGVVLLKFKFLFSMFVSAAVYVWIGGWWFGIGLIVLLFVHEMGHVIEARHQGLPVSAPMFIPFLGAMITMKEMPQDAWREARIGIAGPLLGSAGAAVIYIAGVAYDSQHLKALAFLGFFINLFNLLPVEPARRGQDRRGDPPRDVADRRSRPAGARDPAAEPDPDPDPPRRSERDLAPLEDAEAPGDPGLLPRRAAPPVDHGAAVLRTRRALVFGMHETHVPRNF